MEDARVVNSALCGHRATEGTIHLSDDRYLLFVRTMTAATTEVSTAESKNSAPLSWDRCTSLSPTFSTFPAVFSPHFIRSSTVCPMFLGRTLLIVSQAGRSLLDGATSSEHAETGISARSND